MPQKAEAKRGVVRTHLSQRESKVRLTNCQATHFAVFIFVLSDATQGAGEGGAGGGEGRGGIRKNSKLIEQFKANFCFSRLFFWRARDGVLRPLGLSVSKRT